MRNPGLAIAAACGMVTVGSHTQMTRSTGLLAQVDHLVYATPDLNAGIDKLEKLLGIRASPGGQHPGRGTRNALISIGEGCYIEIIGPDPDQPKPDLSRTFGVDTLSSPRLAAWAAKGNQLAQLTKRAADQGIRLGEVTSGSRRRPDGVLLTWQFTSPLVVVSDGIVPFFIDWGTSQHPAHGAAKGATLVDLRAEHPDQDVVQMQIRQLGLDLRVTKGTAPALIATLDSPRGRVELR